MKLLFLSFGSFPREIKDKSAWTSARAPKDVLLPWKKNTTGRCSKCKLWSLEAEHFAPVQPAADSARWRRVQKQTRSRIGCAAWRASRVSLLLSNPSQIVSAARMNCLFHGSRSGAGCTAACSAHTHRAAKFNTVCGEKPSTLTAPTKNLINLSWAG